MTVLNFVRGRVFLVPVALGLALLLAVACSSGGGGGQTPAADRTPASGQTPASGETATAGETPGGGDTAEIKMVPGSAFDKAELTIPADTEVTITADNTNGFHSFAVYESEDAAQSGEDPIAETEPCGAPCKEAVQVNLSPGEHYFRCQIHNSMNGVLVAE
jgi:plastocyanin